MYEMEKGFGMMAFVVAIIIFFPIIIIWYRFIIDRARNNKDLDIDNITLDERWVNTIFNQQTINALINEYRDKGKLIYTKKGQYRVAFLNDLDKKRSEIKAYCTQGNRFNRDFCDFVQSEYPDAKVKDFTNIMYNFIKKQNNYVQAKFEDFLSVAATITPEDFFEMKKQKMGDIVGVYVIHNETRNMYYVGQAKKLFFRINQHFTGHGNGDVYADYKYGNKFTIKIIKLSDSGYDDIDLLEKDLIKKYNAKTEGYNKTEGNN